MINFNRLLKNIFCFFIIVLPVAFIPGAGFSQILTQKMVLFAFGLLISLVFIAKVLTEGSLSIRKGWIQLVVFIFLLSITLSTIFSKNILLSFWGSFDQSDSLLFLVICILIFFISANVIKRRNTINILECFMVSSAILSVMFLIQDFTKVKLAVFDDVSASAILISFALNIIISFVFNNINYFRGARDSLNFVKISAMGVFFILFVVSLFLMDYRLSWLFVSIGTFFALWRVMIERDFRIAGKKPLLLIALLMIFLSFFFLMGNTAISLPRLSYSDSLAIVDKTLTESPKSLLLGSGVSTYAYQFSLYENKDLNALGLGSAVFNQGAFIIMTFLPTIGILGALSLLAAILVFYIQGFKYFVNFRRRTQDFSINVNDILFPIVFSASFLMFFYKIDILSLTIIFLFLGLWASNQQTEESTYKINDHHKKIIYLAIFLLFALTVAFINYSRAGIMYEQALVDFNHSGDTAKAIGKMEKSSSLWKSTDNYISLSQLYLMQASDIFSEKPSTKAEVDRQKQDIKDLAIKAEGVANFACDIDKNNFQAWQNLGLVYENTNYLVESKLDDALNAYSKAEALAPQNEDVYLAEARLLRIKGDRNASLAKYEKALSLNPGNTDTIRKIDELNKAK